MTDALHRQHEEAERELLMKFYALQREQCGVWASNQGKFVKSRAQFNDMDCTIMEDLFAEWGEDGDSVWIIMKERYTPLSHDSQVYDSKEEAIRKYVRSQCHRESDPDDMDIEGCWEAWSKREGLHAVEATLTLKKKTV
jgi:hypothetical protein